MRKSRRKIRPKNCMKFPILVLTLFVLVSEATSAQFTVTTDTDSGPGSLSEALTSANNNPGFDIINFAIPGTGPFTISLLSPLPDITDPVAIDGYSQPGATPNSLAIGNNAQLRCPEW